MLRGENFCSVENTSPLNFSLLKIIFITLEIVHSMFSDISYVFEIYVIKKDTIEHMEMTAILIF